MAKSRDGLPKPAQDELDRMLHQWRLVRPEIDRDGMALIPRVIRLGHLYNTEMLRVSRSFGLEPGWLDTLSALRRAGSPNQMPATKLANSVLLSSGGMTSRLDRMEAAGLVKRRPDPSDRRGVLVELTKHGLETIDAAIEAHLTLYRELVHNALTESEQRQFIELLRKQTIALENRPRKQKPTSPPDIEHSPSTDGKLHSTAPSGAILRKA